MTPKTKKKDSAKDRPENVPGREEESNKSESTGVDNEMPEENTQPPGSGARADETDRSSPQEEAL